MYSFQKGILGASPNIKRIISRTCNPYLIAITECESSCKVTDKNKTIAPKIPTVQYSIDDKPG